MRILQLISSTGFYGAEGMLLLLSLRLRESGCKISVGVFNGSSKCCEDFVRAAHRDQIPLWDLPCHGRWDTSTVRDLVRFIRRNDIDVLHTHGYKANIYGLFAARLAGCKVVSTCHNWTDRTTTLRRYGSLDRLLLKHFDSVVAVSTNLAMRLSRAGISRKRLHTIPNGIDTAKYQSAKLLAEAPQHLVVGSLSRLSKEKGIDVLIWALPKLLCKYPRLQCVVAGEGPERKRLLALAVELGISHAIHLPGFCEDTPRFLAACTVVAHPSRIEAMPLAVLEAMAAGKAIVASAVGEIPSLFNKGNTGILVPPENPEMLAKGILQLIDDSQMRARIERAAERYAMDHCDASVMARHYIDIYRKTLQYKNGGVLPYSQSEMEVHL